MTFGKYLALATLGFALLLGCGPKPQFEGGEQETNAEETVKSVLEQIAQTGQMGSDIGLMMQALEEMKATDSAKAEALLKDANDLMSTSGADAVKAKAKKMLEKLGGTSQASPSPE